MILVTSMTSAFEPWLTLETLSQWHPHPFHPIVSQHLVGKRFWEKLIQRHRQTRRHLHPTLHGLVFFLRPR